MPCRPQMKKTEPKSQPIGGGVRSGPCWNAVGAMSFRRRRSRRPTAMTDVAISTDAVPPALEAAVELDAAPAHSAEAPAERALPEIEHAVGATRQRILDEFLDLEPGAELSMSQIKAALPGVPSGSVEAAVLREYRSGRILRTSPGHY